MTEKILISTISCPHCGHQSTDACQFFYDCKGCGAVLRPKPGDCCVYCSYGDIKRPPRQSDGSCCDPRRSPSA